jgi:hypothetical protein
MNQKQYLQNLGALLCNLHGLEFMLRCFLAKYNENDKSQVDHCEFTPGDYVPENSFTNYDSLGQLVKKYNDIISQRKWDLDLSIDVEVVKLRDMLAHGRIAGKTKEIFPMTLVKFEKPKPEGVKISANITMDEDWFTTRVPYVWRQLGKVFTASKTLGFDIMEPIIENGS